ncbi:xanthine dehydrogenase [Clostridium botulinum]|uniref:Xanthine dehydrogenase n=2 Tax=Clostridium botulinum TaxID=1491 RepID=A0A6B3XN48_CLOBO|nr:FAD binding domain-containing protein [Clostridium botulinum]APQ73774.1 FAD binding domain in molybdopterin dehydrogenase family protein [Clostridium botulinum]AUM86420.1 xanthine dehydrogenase [Clostridium botulinum]KEI93358.1 xanthine dehydrogenase [Clostridium botulinum B2 267]MBN3383400.1 xanthine dehydrogenase [Clostridium botulinum]MBN3391601.1 xanthine dehydrogenase [Clostridium botulinum]
MIAFNFEYYKPDSLDEAVKLYKELSESGKEPLYYSGGTEIITMARRNDLVTKAVIDIKGIEVVLGHLIGDSSVSIYGKKDKRIVPIIQAFNQRLQLKKGEFLFQLSTEMSYSNLPYIVSTIRSNGEGYPLASTMKSPTIQECVVGVILVCMNLEKDFIFIITM